VAEDNSSEDVKQRMIRRIVTILGIVTVVLSALVTIAYRRDIHAARVRVASGRVHEYALRID